MTSEDPRSHHHKRHAEREDLTGEHRFGDAMQLILMVLFLAVWILDSFILHATTFLAGSVPGYIQWALGGILFICGFGLVRSGIRTVFGNVQETPHVISEGAFSLVRHPIYLGAILFYLGLFSLTLSLASAVLLVFIIAFYWYISGYEEKLLIQRFGDEYLNYKQRVPMLFPLKLF